jgi:alkylation response protein AidB-like acyl-CoA dehydrogenase
MEIPRLKAATPAGERMVAAATRFADEFADGALMHDRDATFAVEHLEKLRADGYLVAPIPTAFGGGGVASIHDVLVASSRLARGDAATSIGVNMHLSIVLNMVRWWQIAVERWDERSSQGMAELLSAVVAHDIVLAAAASEPPPQDLARPTTTATRTEAGWTISGRKVFATMAPHATLLVVAVSFVDALGRDRYGFATVPSAADGVVFGHDWDGLGMRASASGSVTFDQVRLPETALADGFPAGEWSAGMLDRYLVSGALHAATALGVAEGAHEQVVARLRARAGEEALTDAHLVGGLAANVTELVAMRAALGRAGTLIDEHHRAHPLGEAPLAEVQAAFAEVQAVKAFLADAAVRVVDRAMALSGGAGYVATHPIAKAWRDARAVAFMHPLGANRVGPLLARTELQLTP